MEMNETRISGELIYDGIIVHLYKDDVILPNKKNAVREVIRHQGAVCVVAIDDNRDIYLVQQYRYPFSDVLTEIPAGKLDVGEQPIDCAARELKEETGIVANKYTYLGKLYTSPAFLDEVIHIYLATELSFEKQNPDEDEFVEVIKTNIDEFVKEILADKIPDGKTQAAVLRAYLAFNSMS